MKTYEVIWEERHKTIIRAENCEDALEKAQDVDSSFETYQECTYKEVNEI